VLLLSRQHHARRLERVLGLAVRRPLGRRGRGVHPTGDADVDATAGREARADAPARVPDDAPEVLDDRLVRADL